MKTRTIGCLDAATDVLGDKWTPRLLRMFASQSAVRFCELQDYAGEINPRTLSARLVKLEEMEIISKQPTSASRCEYTLTEKGRDLMPVLESMHAWSEKYSS